MDKVTDEYLNGLQSVGFDWKEKAESILPQINEALRKAESGVQFHRIDDQQGDSYEYVLLKEGKPVPTVMEWRAFYFGECAEHDFGDGDVCSLCGQEE